MDHKISIELSVADLREMIANVRNMDEAALSGLMSLLATTGGKTASAAASVTAAPVVKEGKPKPTIRESSNYFPLFKHLRDNSKDEIAMTFKEIEKILGVKKLPQSAYDYPSWWGNNLKKRTGQSKSWLDAGYQTHSVNMDKKTINFRKY